MKNILTVGLVGLSLVACDRSGDDYVPAADGTYPPVIDVGEMAVMTADLLTEMRSQGGNARTWCRETWMRTAILLYYGLLGPLV